MGSFIEINDTLQITREQGFPEELVYDKHVKDPITLDQVKDKVYTFHGKKSIRLYKTPPVRNFLVENVGGKWLYWGLVHILEVTHDNVEGVTSGKFKITKIYTPEEMEEASNYIDGRASKDYFS